MSLWLVTLLLLLVVLAAALLQARSRRPAETVGGGANAGVLFHGSPRRLLALEPRPSAVIGGERAVFATPSRWLALVFATQAGNSDIEFGFAGNKAYIAEKREGGFDALASPGYIHTVPARGFHGDKRLGMQQHEFIHAAEVPVVEIESVPDVRVALHHYDDLVWVRYSDYAAWAADNGIPPD